MSVLVSAAARDTEPQRQIHPRTPLTRQAGSLPVSVTRLLATDDSEQAPIVSAFQSSV